MQEDDGPQGSLRLPQNIFQAAASDELAQRLEAIALELRAIGSPQAGIFANNETLGLLSAVLQSTLRKIDQIFEFDGFVFTAACSLLLELFQACARGAVLSSAALFQAVNCPPTVAIRWIKALESMQLLETIGQESGDPKVALTEKGYFKVSEALKLFL